EHLSKLTGQTTVVKEQVTTSGRGWSTNVRRSTHEVSRPLLTPDEAMRMKGARKNAQGMITEPGNMVIYVAGYPAIMGLQPLYFRGSELARRARIPAVTQPWFTPDCFTGRETHFLAQVPHREQMQALVAASEKVRALLNPIAEYNHRLEQLLREGLSKTCCLRPGNWFDFNVIDTRQDHKSRSPGFCVHHNEARFRLLFIMR